MDGEDNIANVIIVVCCKLVGHVQCQWTQGRCKLVGGLGCGCARCVGHNACYTKLVQNSYQFHIRGDWGVNNCYDLEHCWFTIYRCNFFSNHLH
jgi:hypothetical protein